MDRLCSLSSACCCYVSGQSLDGRRFIFELAAVTVKLKKKKEKTISTIFF